MKLARESLPYEVLSRPPARRRLFDSKISRIPTQPFEETKNERLVLLVFAEQDSPDLPAHVSQPRATNSDNLRPLCDACRPTGRAVVAPDALRSRISP